MISQLYMFFTSLLTLQVTFQFWLSIYFSPTATKRYSVLIYMYESLRNFFCIFKKIIDKILIVRDISRANFHVNQWKWIKQKWSTPSDDWTPIQSKHLRHIDRHKSIFLQNLSVRVSVKSEISLRQGFKSMDRKRTNEIAQWK